MVSKAVPAILPLSFSLGFSRRLILAASLLVAGGACASAQAPSFGKGLQASMDMNADALPDAPQPQDQDAAHAGSGRSVTLRGTPARILDDQAAIWSSPFHLHGGDFKWLVPLGLVTAATITIDHQTVTSSQLKDKQLNDRSDKASNVLTGGLVALPVALFGAGQFGHDDKARETGILGGEALVDSLAVEQGMKLIFWRERPADDRGRGKFFQSSAGADGSFPSSHSVFAWSSAAVLAEEYPAWWAQAGVYSAAAGVSLTRVMALQHFPSDVLVGSAVGWMVGHYVVRKHRKVRPLY